MKQFSSKNEQLLKSHSLTITFLAILNLLFVAQLYFYHRWLPFLFFNLFLFAGIALYLLIKINLYLRSKSKQFRLAEMGKDVGIIDLANHYISEGMKWAYCFNPANVDVLVKAVVKLLIVEILISLVSPLAFTMISLNYQALNSLCKQKLGFPIDQSFEVALKLLQPYNKLIPRFPYGNTNYQQQHTPVFIDTSTNQGYAAANPSAVRFQPTTYMQYPERWIDVKAHQTHSAHKEQMFETYRSEATNTSRTQNQDYKAQFMSEVPRYSPLIADTRAFPQPQPNILPRQQHRILSYDQFQIQSPLAFNQAIPNLTSVPLAPVVNYPSSKTQRSGTSSIINQHFYPNSPSPRRY